MNNLLELQTKVLQWASEKGLLDNVTEERITAQAHKVLEEIGETCGAYLKNNRDELLDGIGDIAVTLILINEMDDFDHINFDHSDDTETDNSLLDVTTAFMKGKYPESMEHLHRFALSQDTTLVHCLELAYNVIAKRKGRMVGETFIKD